MQDAQPGYPDSYREELVSELRARRTVVVVGAGVTASASDGHGFATWRGLLLAGVDRACRRGAANLSKDWTSAMRKIVESKDSDAEDLVCVASEVTRQLDAYGDGEYSGWLRATVGWLPEEYSLSLSSDGGELSGEKYELRETADRVEVRFIRISS